MPPRSVSSVRQFVRFQSWYSWIGDLRTFFFVPLRGSLSWLLFTEIAFLLTPEQDPVPLHESPVWLEWVSVCGCCCCCFCASTLRSEDPDSTLSSKIRITVNYVFCRIMQLLTYLSHFPDFVLHLTLLCYLFRNFPFLQFQFWFHVFLLLRFHSRPFRLNSAAIT